MMPIIWGVIAAATLILELSTAALLSIWFTAGAVVALILSLLDLPIFIQILAFVIVSGALFFVAWKYIIKKRPEKTNGKSPLIGKRANVVETVDFEKGTGKVNVNDQYWKVISTDKEKTFRKGEILYIVDVKGTTLIVDDVEPKDKEVQILEKTEEN